MAVEHLTMEIGEYGYKKSAVAKRMFPLMVIDTWCQHHVSTSIKLSKRVAEDPCKSGIFPTLLLSNK